MKTKLTVRNCPVEFRFQCSKLWDELAPTDQLDVRHCHSCSSDVFFCVTDAETIAHAKAGHCIAREVPDGSELPTVSIGQPRLVPAPSETQSKAGLWNVREKAIDDSIRNAARSSRSCPRCHYPAPDWRITCRVCGFAMGRVTSGSGE